MNQISIIPRLLNFKETKRNQTITIENNSNNLLTYELCAAKYTSEDNNKIITLFQSNKPNGKIDAKSKENIIIQYIGNFTKKQIDKAEILQITIEIPELKINENITIDCEFKETEIINDYCKLDNKIDDDLDKIVNILNLNEDDKNKSNNLSTIKEILTPLKPKHRNKKRKFNCLIFFLFLISLLIFSFSIYVTFLDEENDKFKKLIDLYNLNEIAKLCLENELFNLFRILSKNHTFNLQSYNKYL